MKFDWKWFSVALLGLVSPAFADYSIPLGEMETSDQALCFKHEILRSEVQNEDYVMNGSLKITPTRMSSLRQLSYQDYDYLTVVGATPAICDSSTWAHLADSPDDYNTPLCNDKLNDCVNSMVGDSSAYEVYSVNVNESGQPISSIKNMSFEVGADDLPIFVEDSYFPEEVIGTDTVCGAVSTFITYPMLETLSAYSLESTFNIQNENTDDYYWTCYWTNDDYWITDLVWGLDYLSQYVIAEDENGHEVLRQTDETESQYFYVDRMGTTTTEADQVDDQYVNLSLGSRLQAMVDGGVQYTESGTPYCLANSSCWLRYVQGTLDESHDYLYLYAKDLTNTVKGKETLIEALTVGMIEQFEFVPAEMPLIIGGEGLDPAVYNLYGLAESRTPAEIEAETDPYSPTNAALFERTSDFRLVVADSLWSDEYIDGLYQTTNYSFQNHLEYLISKDQELLASDGFLYDTEGVISPLWSGQPTEMSVEDEYWSYFAFPREYANIIDNVAFKSYILCEPEGGVPWYSLSPPFSEIQTYASFDKESLALIFGKQRTTPVSWFEDRYIINTDAFNVYIEDEEDREVCTFRPFLEITYSEDAYRSNTDGKRVSTITDRNPGFESLGIFSYSFGYEMDKESTNWFLYTIWEGVGGSGFLSVKTLLNWFFDFTSMIFTWLFETIPGFSDIRTAVAPTEGLPLFDEFVFENPSYEDIKDDCGGLIPVIFETCESINTLYDPDNFLVFAVNSRTYDYSMFGNNYCESRTGYRGYESMTLSPTFAVQGVCDELSNTDWLAYIDRTYLIQPITTSNCPSNSTITIESITCSAPSVPRTFFGHDLTNTFPPELQQQVATYEKLGEDVVEIVRIIMWLVFAGWLFNVLILSNLGINK